MNEREVSAHLNNVALEIDKGAVEGKKTNHFVAVFVVVANVAEVAQLSQRVVVVQMVMAVVMMTVMMSTLHQREEESACKAGNAKTHRQWP